MATASVSSPVSIKNILFVTDLAEASRAALPYAIALAQRYHSQVVLVHALGAVPFSPIPYEAVPPLDTRPRQMVLPQLEELRKECIVNGIPTKLALKDGELLEVMDMELREEKPDLIVLGTHSHGALHRLLMGSHAELVVRGARCGVLLVGRKTVAAARWRDRIARILLATNYEEGSQHAIEYIAPLAVEHDSEVTLLHVVDEPVGVPLDAAEIEMNRSTQGLLEFAARTRLPHAPHLELRVGHPYQEIVDYSNRNDMDLIVLGRRKGGFFADHKPSTTVISVAAEARCPVLTLG